MRDGGTCWGSTPWDCMAGQGGRQNGIYDVWSTGDVIRRYKSSIFEYRRVTENMGVDLQSITLRLRAEESGGKVVTERDDVLWCLVDRKVPDIAAL